MSSLAFLSIARVGHSFWRRRKVPHVPTNTERLQAWRTFAPVQFANTVLPSLNNAGAVRQRNS